MQISPKNGIFEDNITKSRNMPVQLAQRLINVEEYFRMAEAGILSWDDRVELIRGQIIQMSPIGSKHAACVDRFNSIFHQLINSDVAIIRVQNPVQLSEYSEPEPDVSVLKPDPDFYSKGHPQPKDILLIIEVADTSFDYDKEIKLSLYAEAHIPEYWIANLEKGEIEAYSNPAGDGYLKMERFLPGSEIVFTGLKLRFPVNKLLV